MPRVLRYIFCLEPVCSSFSLTEFFTADTVRSLLLKAAKQDVKEFVEQRRQAAAAHDEDASETRAGSAGSQADAGLAVARAARAASEKQVSYCHQLDKLPLFSSVVVNPYASQLGAILCSRACGRHGGQACTVASSPACAACFPWKVVGLVKY